MTTGIKKIHHYTSVEILELILSSKRIRFTRVDQVDDVREAQTHLGIEFGKYFFVSCWTLNQVESIPQWKMYSDEMKGVRISLPSMPFKRKKLHPPPYWNMESEGEIWSIFSLEEQLEKGYFIVPMFMDEAQFANSVKYVDDIERRYSEAIELKDAPQGKASLTIYRLSDLVCLKSKDWQFQEEYRFFLFILPSISMPKDGPGSPDFYEKVPNHILNSMLNGVEPSIDYIDLELSEEALANIEVTIGPHCDGAAKLKVESLMSGYAPSGQVRSSNLTGKIRITK